MKTFKEIIAWQKGYQLTLMLYRNTVQFPKGEEFGLKSQLRRAAVSVISNIAEGYKKISPKERLQFYKIAESSLEEMKCQTMLAHDLDYLHSTNYNELSKLEDETGKVLNGLIQAQRNFIS